MTTRDFTSETKNKLLKVVDQVSVPSDAAWYKRFADWLGDNNALVHEQMDMDYVNGLTSVSAYQRDLIDRNNMTKQQIKEIWTTVNEDNNVYTSRLSAVEADLNGLIAALDRLAEIISPSKGAFTPDAIAKINEDLNHYLQNSRVLGKLASKGLTAKDLSDLGKQGQKDLIDGILNFWLNSINPTGAEGKWSLSLGPYLKLTYSVSADADKDSPVSLKGTIDDQKKMMLNLKYTGFAGNSFGLNSDGNPTSTLSIPSGPAAKLGGGWSYSSGVDTNGKSDINLHWTHRYKNTSYTITVGGNSQRLSNYFSYKISSDVGKSRVSSEAKIEASVPTSGWGKIPVPVPYKAPAFKLPKLTWEKIKQYLTNSAKIGAVVVLFAGCAVVVVNVARILMIQATAAVVVVAPK